MTGTENRRAGGRFGTGWWSRWLAPGLGAALLLAGGLGWWAAPKAELPAEPLTAALPVPSADAAAPAQEPKADGSAADLLPGGVLPEEALTDEVLPKEEKAAPARSARRISQPISAQEREARRFNRQDRDKNGVVSREEFLAARRKAFDRLDRNRDGQLSFEEFAAATAARFDAADRNADRLLNRSEFAATAAQRSPARRAKG